ncbi:hypothetical protein HPB48_001287 [Haemaphysalis longicornis]|uniref:Peritrophic membrane chitin binding protein n=1 Tax=Haemaphysalis longicornis TaxID=44386 RepID=A0A9J6FDR9_HAELO|nr:hypothetical protein HPB48_001287 [Haemaphysalis longicornis]
MPQFVTLTFDGAVNVNNMPFYRELLKDSGRKNKQNQCAIKATFFLTGEYLDYEAVNELHRWDNEIAVKSISQRTDPNYWLSINSTQWAQEVVGQRTMLKAFANVPTSDVNGFRGPFLRTGGDEGFKMLHKNSLYDSTLVHPRVRGEPPVYPYTMDYGFRRPCNVQRNVCHFFCTVQTVLSNIRHTEPCRPGGWYRVTTCTKQNELLGMHFSPVDKLLSNFDEFYTTNRAPFPLFIHQGYLKHPERKAGYLQFLDWLLQKDDVYLVTASEVLRFMKNPEPLSAYAKRACTNRSNSGPSNCLKPNGCTYKNTPTGYERFMKTCSKCPKNYPWVNNPLGN